MSADHPLFDPERGDGPSETAAPAVRPASQLPEPGRFSIRYTPRRRGSRCWPGATGPWLDLSTGRPYGLDEHDGADTPHEEGVTALPRLDAGEPLDDVVYLPPVPPELQTERQDLARRLREQGTPVRVHRFAGDPDGFHEDDVFDLLPTLLSGRLEAVVSVPVGALVAWPLIQGVTDDPAVWEESCQALAVAGAMAVQGVVVELSPADRRALLEREGEELFDALFHGPPPQVRDLARVVRRNGMAVFAPRPVPRPPTLPAARVENRRLAGQLALAAELSDRLGRAPETAQSLFRAAREADRTPYDLTALAREGNLGVLDWLQGEALALVRATVAGRGRPGEGPLAPLLDEYAGPPVS